MNKKEFSENKELLVLVLSNYNLYLLSMNCAYIYEGNNQENEGEVVILGSLSLSLGEEGRTTLGRMPKGLRKCRGKGGIWGFHVCDWEGETILQVEIARKFNIALPNPTYTLLISGNTN